MSRLVVKYNPPSMKFSAGLPAVKVPVDKFVVTLTPLSTDYSGSMDKTAGEITAAYKAGKEIVFKITSFPGFDNVEIPCNSVTFASGSDIGCFHAEIIDIETGSNILILTADSSESILNYNTHIYPYPSQYIVNLYPINDDFSGFMDKEVSQIAAAYESGKSIVFRVNSDGNGYIDVDCTARYYGGYEYPSFNGYVVSGGQSIMCATEATDDGEKRDYVTEVYNLDYNSAQGVSF